MPNSNLEEAVEALVALLEPLARSLHEIGEERWATWIEKSTRCLQNRDLYGVDYLLRAYGGMGSLNDIDVPLVNELRSRVWVLAKHVQRISN